MALAAVVAGVAGWFIVATPVDASSRASTPEVAITLPATWSAPPSTTAASPSAAATRRPVSKTACRVGTPARLVIPALKINAPFERIGLDQTAKPDAQGKRPLGNPTDRTKAGWYADGPKPGSGVGTVLTNGHTYRNGSAIFDEDFASAVRAGQLIHIVQDNGSICSYRIDRVWPEVNSRRDFPRIVTSEHLYDFTGPERLFLATCGGSWNAATQNYDDISILIATPVNRG